jgi:hypothetical protein
MTIRFPGRRRSRGDALVHVVRTHVRARFALTVEDFAAAVERRLDGVPADQRAAF